MAKIKISPFQLNLLLLMIMGSIMLPIPTKSEGTKIIQELPVGFTEDGDPFRGNPEAPVTLIEFSDYLCPYCARYSTQTGVELLEKYGQSGQVKFVFHQFPLVTLHPTAPKGSAAALCVAEQSPELFWKMHDALMENQKEWNKLTNPAEYLASVAEEISADMEAYHHCIDSGVKDTQVLQNVDEGKALGFNGTPAFQLIQNVKGKTYSLSGAQPVEVFSEWLDKLIAGEEPPEPKKPELPDWAKPEGLAPDPKRPGFTVAGDSYKGDPKAKIAVVEYTDFQCPPCKEYEFETQPGLDKELIETGKVFWVVKHFPLRIHPHATIAAVAAECAGSQRKYWDMHHALFEKVDQWTESDDADTELLKIAGELELEMSQFKMCFNSRQGLQRVLDDIYDAQGIIRSTPTFLIIQGEKSYTVRGAKSAKNLASILSKMLETGKPGE